MATINSFDFREASAGDRVSASLNCPSGAILPRKIVIVSLRESRRARNGSEKDIMTKVEAIIQNSKLEAVKTALQEIGVEGMTVMEVRGHGRQKGHTEVYRGREYSVDLIPKTKLELVLADTMVEKGVQAILGAARTGKIGDGKIFLSHIDEAIRIRNDERGEGAL
jgi:nitrogen regulatory protein P-II 1